MSDSPCPREDTLAAYVEGRVDDDELAGIASHLIRCETCYNAVAAKARRLATSGRPETVAPPLALLPALLTAAVIAIALTLSLSQLL